MITMKDRKCPKGLQPDVWETRTKRLEVRTDCEPKQIKVESDLHNLNSSPVLRNCEIKWDETGGLFRRDYIGVMCIQNFSRKAGDKTSLLTYAFIYY
jgi:hypothetical protein